MTDYGRKQYLEDCENPEMPHIKSREHFISFYNELGRDEIQYKQNYDDCIVSALNVQPKKNVLELGCHWGFNLIHFAEMGFNCVGVEISKPLIEYGEKVLSEGTIQIKERVKFVNCMIEDFVPDKKYDTILVTETLEHVVDPLLILKKARECISDDGTIWVSSPNLRHGTFAHVRGIIGEEMIELLQEAGFQNIQHDPSFSVVKTTVCSAQI